MSKQSKNQSELFGVESLRSIEMKFKEYHKRVATNDPTVSAFELAMYKAFERALGERGYKFEDHQQPLFYKRVS